MTPLPPAMLAAILAQPDLDGPRLVAADWWEEQGEMARAEFTRFQLELANPWSVINNRFETVGEFETLREALHRALELEKENADGKPA